MSDNTELSSLHVRLNLDSGPFKKNLQTISAGMRALQGEYNALTGHSRQFANSLEGLRGNSNRLTQTIDLQRQRIQLLRTEYDNIVAREGENSRSALRMRAAYENARGSMSRMQRQLDETNRRIQFQSTSWGRLSTSLSGTSRRLTEAGRSAKETGQHITSVFGPATMAIGAGLGVAVKKAADFESQMSSVKSVMDPADIKQFGGALKDLAIKTGAATKYSATEAAQGIEELEKAGVSTTDIINGGLTGALNLATAGELSLKDAAEVASTALNSFKKDNISVTRAADLLAGAANASATDVGELKFGLSAVSAVASGVGLTFEDTSTALAEFAQNGLKGQDAGTSLKTMLLNLSPQTSTAIDQMRELGLVTQNNGMAYKWLIDHGMKPASSSTKDLTDALMKEAKAVVGAKAGSVKINSEFKKLSTYSGFVSSAFYDQNGKLLDMKNISELLRKSLSGLSEEQKQNALKTMFGTDAIRASNILAREGAKGFDKMNESMNKVTANQVAKQKMDNLKGSIEQLKGSLETAAITVGNALIPEMKALAHAVQSGVDWFNHLSPAAQQWITKGALVAGGLAAIGTAAGAGLMGLGAFKVGLGTIMNVGAKVTGSLAGSAGAVEGVGAAAAGTEAAIGGAAAGAGGLATALEIASGPIGWTALGLTAAGVAAYKMNEHMKKPIMTVDLFGDKVSKTTKKAIGAYMEMNNKITEQLNAASYSGKQIIAEMKDASSTIIDKFFVNKAILL